MPNHSDILRFEVGIPKDFKIEIKYIVKEVFSCFQDCEVLFSISDKEDYQLSIMGSDLSIRLPNLFFKKEKEIWLQKRAPSDWGLMLEKNEFPVFFNDLRIKYDESGIDYFGTIFFLLNRYHEQVEKLPLDEHNRIDGRKTLLVREGLISIPIVDVYLVEFSKLIERSFGISLNKLSTYEILPSHDVDRPFEYLYLSKRRITKRVLGDVLLRKSPKRAHSTFLKYTAIQKGNLTEDPYNTFDWIMQRSEENNRISTFHFIAENTNPRFDQSYSIENREIQQIFEKIVARGHGIALHPSYNSSAIKGQTKHEFDRLKSVLNTYGIFQDQWKSRNHYLRWNEKSISELENAGIDVDQTLGFAEIPGFRCGTSLAFRPFNFLKSKPSSILSEPLIVMEVSLFSKTYQNLGANLPDAWNMVENLKTYCQKYDGNFTVLWHNNNLSSDTMKEFYLNCIK